MKKTIAILLALVMALGLFAGCAASTEGESTAAPTTAPTTAPTEPAPPADAPVVADCAYCEEEDVEWTKWTATDALPAEAGHYILQNDVTLTAECNWKNSGVLCLDLNGKTVTQTTVGQRIGNIGAAVVSIFDSSAEGTGKFRPANAPETEDKAVMQWWWAVGFLCSSDAEFNIYGGTIDCSGLTVGKYGGCIVMDSGTLNIYGGKLIGGNTVAPGSGGSALMIMGPATCNMSGGEIIGGTVNSEHSVGGGGTMRITGTFYMTGGKIVGGTTNKDGGAIYLSGKLFVSPGALITGGTADGLGDTIYVKAGAELNLGTGVELGKEIVGEVYDANTAS